MLAANFPSPPRSRLSCAPCFLGRLHPGGLFDNSWLMWLSSSGKSLACGGAVGTRFLKGYRKRGQDSRWERVRIWWRGWPWSSVSLKSLVYVLVHRFSWDLMPAGVGSSVVQVLRTQPLMILRASLNGMFNFFARQVVPIQAHNIVPGPQAVARVDVCKTLEDVPQLRPAKRFKGAR